MRILTKVMLGCCGISMLACLTPKRVKPIPQPVEEKVGLVAKGESFSNLTLITENQSACTEATTANNGLVAFRCYKDNNWDIYLKKNPTATAIQKITTHGATDLDPALSPDGKRLAFSSNRSGNYDIFIVNVGAAAKQQVTDSSDNEYAPNWSPDGQKLTYMRKSKMDKKYYIWIRDLKTNANIQIGEGLFPQFSPDGKTLLFQQASKTGERWYGLWTMDLQGSNRTQLINSDKWAAILAKWSPDGKKIVFVSKKGTVDTFVARDGVLDPADIQSHNLWSINPDGTALTQLTSHPQPDLHPTWSKDNHIYFTSYRDGKQRIWRFTPTFPDGYVPAKPGETTAPSTQ